MSDIGNNSKIFNGGHFKMEHIEKDIKDSI